jgi:mono/diheme cytochrome c family protein
MEDGGLRIESRELRTEDRRLRLFLVDLAFAILPSLFSILVSFRTPRPPSSILVLFLALTALVACRQQMANQPYHQPLETSEFFGDGMASRPAPAGTVPHETAQETESPSGAKAAGKSAREFPFALDMAVMTRGQERYNIYCAPCHDRIGSGEGMVVQRGFTKARSFHSPELRAAPAGHYFDVMTNGFGAMPSYAHAVTPRDRWAIAAYIRALQFSRHAPAAELAAEDHEKLQEAR